VLRGRERHPVKVRPVADGHAVEFEGESYELRSDWQFGQPFYRGTCNREPICVQVERRGLNYRLFHFGFQADFMVLSARAAELLAHIPDKAPPDLSKFLLSPMPGLLAELNVETGQEVKAGQMLAVIEAMKMENVLRAEADGVFKAVLAQAGDSLAVDQPILEFR
jgi:propionyl-CoA carboxylase alpha subunit